VIGARVGTGVGVRVGAGAGTFLEERAISSWRNWSKVIWGRKMVEAIW